MVTHHSASFVHPYLALLFVTVSIYVSTLILHVYFDHKNNIIINIIIIIIIINSTVALPSARYWFFSLTPN